LADLFGHAFNYLSLSRQFSGDRAFYGVTPGPLQDAFARKGDLGALTRAFLGEIRQVRPQGPYVIAGYSAGGLLALELACVLEGEGEEVRLILLDSELPSRRSAGRRMPPATSRLPRSGSASRLQEWRPALGRLRHAVSGGFAPAWIPRSQVAFATRMIRLGGRYQPAAFLGRTLLITATGQGPVQEALNNDDLMGWSDALRGPVTRAFVAGGHHQFLRDPLVSESADAIRRFLTSSIRTT
jgi:thioesterase domain-containing protein